MAAVQIQRFARGFLAKRRLREKKQQQRPTGAPAAVPSISWQWKGHGDSTSFVHVKCDRVWLSNHSWDARQLAEALRAAELASLQAQRAKKSVQQFLVVYLFSAFQTGPAKAPGVSKLYITNLATNRPSSNVSCCHLSFVLAGIGIFEP